MTPVLRVERCGAGVVARLFVRVAAETGAGGTPAPHEGRGAALTVIWGSGRLAGEELAEALGAGWLVLDDTATLDFGGCAGESALGLGLEEDRARARSRAREGVVAARAIQRIGRRAIPFLIEGTALRGDRAVAAGLADGVVAAGSDPVEWIVSWFGKRSALALASAASLLRARGGDAAERAEFARLFASGEPQRGLASFLEKRAPDFEPLTVEIL